MNFVLLIVMFITLASSPAMACAVKLRIDKNQTTYSLLDFNRFLKKLPLLGYVIRENNYEYLINVRLTRQELYDEPDMKMAMVSIDVYDPQKKLLSHSMASGKPSKLGLAAFNVLQYEKALIDLIKELPSCL
jgi:hypothetical protein